VLVSDFDFELPAELIAQEPAPRGESRLLVLDRGRGAIEHATVRDLPRFFHPGDLLVVNDTRVFAARLIGRRVPTGGSVECLLLGGADHDALRRPDAVCGALMHPGQKLKPGARVVFEGAASVLSGEVLERHFFGRRTIRLRAESPPGATVEDLVEAIGHVPLPPYIKRPDAPGDRERYQTVYARARGSVAAPTAGLHFTPDILARLDGAGVLRAAVTLHVGYGTFKPVRAERVEDHVVDPEYYEISVETASAIYDARSSGRRVVAVGTTTTRALEDAAARGGGRVSAGAREATTFIYPPFGFRAVDALMTNFHLPRSSLLMLVSAFAGRDLLLEAYRTAVANRYRFYSYGDAMLIV
jgi:S-adenosylmethionine:tRNA ribosyltransferase-isomerase